MTWHRIPIPTKAELAEHRRQMKKARFLVDQDVDIAVADWLRQKGYNTVHVTEVASLVNHDDKDVFAFAHRDNRILVTHDDDFLNDRHFSPQRNPGMVVIPQTPHDTIALVRMLIRMVDVIGMYREQWRQSKVRISDPHRWSVSSFNRRTGHVVETKFRFLRNGMVDIWED